MDFLGHDMIGLITYLVPGFLAAWIFHSLTSHTKGNQFERLVQAIIFSFFIGIVVSAIQWTLLNLTVIVEVGRWSDEVQSIWGALTAFIFGFTAAYLANTDRIMPTLRSLGFTSRTTYPSEWYQALHEHRNWLVLHLEDGRRLAGYPKLWPNNNVEGYFEILQPSWIEGGLDKPMTGCSSIVIPANTIKWLELLEIDNGTPTSK